MAFYYMYYPFNTSDYHYRDFNFTMSSSFFSLEDDYVLIDW